MFAGSHRRLRFGGWFHGHVSSCGGQAELLHVVPLPLMFQRGCCVILVVSCCQLLEVWVVLALCKDRSVVVAGTCVQRVAIVRRLRLRVLLPGHRGLNVFAHVL